MPVGEPAINPVPRKMILEGVETVCREYGYTGGLVVEISVPEGEALAARTFNPRLGIVGRYFHSGHLGHCGTHERGGAGGVHRSGNPHGSEKWQRVSAAGGRAITGKIL